MCGQGDGEYKARPFNIDPSLTSVLCLKLTAVLCICVLPFSRQFHAHVQGAYKLNFSPASYREYAYAPRDTPLPPSTHTRIVKGVPLH